MDVVVTVFVLVATGSLPEWHAVYRVGREEAVVHLSASEGHRGFGVCWHEAHEKCCCLSVRVVLRLGLQHGSVLGVVARG